MRPTVLLTMALALLAGATGCSATAYYSARSANTHRVPVSRVRAAATTAAAQEIEGAPWTVEHDTPGQFRAIHENPERGHTTTVILLLHAEQGGEGCSFEAIGESAAAWSWITFGLTSRNAVDYTKGKAEVFVSALREVLDGG